MPKVLRLRKPILKQNCYKHFFKLSFEPNEQVIFKKEDYFRQNLNILSHSLREVNIIYNIMLYIIHNKVKIYNFLKGHNLGIIINLHLYSRRIFLCVWYIVGTQNLREGGRDLSSYTILQNTLYKRTETKIKDSTRLFGRCPPKSSLPPSHQHVTSHSHLLPSLLCSQGVHKSSLQGTCVHCLEDACPSLPLLPLLPEFGMWRWHCPSFNHADQANSAGPR